MANIWLLTEERPKIDVIKEIIQYYCQCCDSPTNYSFANKPFIQPLFNSNNLFNFIYEVHGIYAAGIDKIYISTVSGNSSFFDFLLFVQRDVPSSSLSEQPLMSIEETKTSDRESRNTGVFQRGSKFVFIENYYPNVYKYMLYNNENSDNKANKRISDTNVFGTNMFLTLGIKIVGKNIEPRCQPFNSLQELIQFKNNMRRPPANNIPILIEEYPDKITISGRLSKPAKAHNICHDPNIGALSLIGRCIRVFEPNKPIVIKSHGVSQEYLNKTRGKNKFLYICKMLNMQLEGLMMPAIELPKQYWHYERSSEKVASILLHIICVNNGMKCVYENHAGCERGYFWTKDGSPIALPKDMNGKIPDVVLYCEEDNIIILVEGKKMSTINDGLKELNNFDSFEHNFLNCYYPRTNVLKYLSIYGGNQSHVPHQQVLFYLNDVGKVYVNPKAPQCVTKAVSKAMSNVFNISAK